jgi:putative redox protein
MSIVNAKLSHVEELKFNAEVQDGRKIELNSANDMGAAFTPMELFLVSVGGCTAMDVQWIMDKQRQKVDNFEISISGTRRQEDPKYYETIDLEYMFHGQGLRKDAVERAIRLSQEEYCSVRAMLKDSVKLKITYTIANGPDPVQKYTYSAQKSVG